MVLLQDRTLSQDRRPLLLWAHLVLPRSSKDKATVRVQIEDLGARSESENAELKGYLDGTEGDVAERCILILADEVAEA